MVDTLWFGSAAVGCSPIPAAVWAHDRGLSPLPHDPQAASALLAAAGWADHDGDGVLDRDGVPFRFELLTNVGNEQRWDALQMIRQDLAEVGIDALPRRLELLAVGAALEKRTYDAAVTAFGIGTHLDLGFWFHSKNAAPGGYNYGGYRSEPVDRLLDQIAAAEDRRAVLGQFHELQRLVHDDQPVLFLWEPRGLVAFSSSLEHVRPNELGLLGNLEEWSWRRAEPGSADGRRSGTAVPTGS
jgi:peptide/nickel transport system substrate-binding protein